MAQTHLLHGGSKLSGAQDGQMSTLSTSAELQRNCLSDWGGEGGVGNLRVYTQWGTRVIHGAACAIVRLGVAVIPGVASLL